MEKEAKLAQLAELHESGILSDEEYFSAKKKAEESIEVVSLKDNKQDTRVKNMETKNNELQQRSSGSKNDKDEDDDDGSWIKGCVSIVLIAVCVWVMWHYNPSESDHRQVVEQRIDDASAKLLVDGYSFGDIMFNFASLKGNLKYHSFGICSWTTSKEYGSTTITTFGVLGWTCPLFKIDSRGIEYKLAF